ncbi:MAG: amino acid adenylation domain-containing protein, partial [Vicinamibacterales bacterium]
AIEQTLAAVPAGGRAFGMCRDLSPNGRLRRALSAIPPADVIVNYLGRIDRLSAQAAGVFSSVSLPPACELRDDRDRPAYPLEVNAYHQDGALHVALRFDRSRVPSEWIDALTARYRALLEGVEGGPYPLTPMQQGILFHTVLQPDVGSYIQQVVARFDGEPDVAVLREAWDAVLARHPSLRNVFQWTGLDAPQQQAMPTARMPWQSEDWRSKSGPEFETGLERWLVADRARGFDLTEGPLHRVQLFLARGGCTLVWTHHHILLDGRGMFLVLHEVLEQARAMAAGRAVALPPPASFRAFAGALGQPASPAALDYWTKELAPFTERTEIPFLSRAVDGAAYDSQEVTRSLSSTVSDALRRQARQAGVSLNLLVQSMLALQLQRLTGSCHVLFGTTVSAELDNEAAAGLYINTIPVPVTVSRDTTLADWLAGERSRQAGRAPFEFVGLAEIQRCAALDAGESLFDLLFVFDNYPLAAGLLQPAAGLTPRSARVVEQTTLPLVLSVLPGAEIEVRLQHDAARYQPEAAASFLNGFVSLLERAARHPADTEVATLARLEGPERERVLRTWNQTAVAVPGDRCMHELVAAQVAAGPDRLAIRAAGKAMTYAALDTRARQIAAALRARKVGRGSVVGLCAGRAADTIAALLGILYAGAAYLPLDPAFPEDRLAFMLDDARASLTLCDATAPAALRTRFAAIAPVVDLADIAGGDTSGPHRMPSQPSDLMYVLYTSGSTGRPKGVQIPHRTVVNLLSTMRDDPGLSAEDVVLALTTFSFDIAVVEIFLTLSVGATMVMADHAADPRHLLRLIADEKVTLVQATPATYRLLLEAGWERRPGVRAFCGGEALSKDLSHAILQRCDRLWNLYGPTETTVYSIGCEIPRTAALTPGAEPIGRPLANTLAYVLDEQMEPVPVGAPGELFIAGAGVGDGYRGNAALTAERFVPNPFEPSRGAVMYRTGDRARWRPDGTLDYLGRLDHQVKVRGYRIELEEIESVLGGHPDVTHAVVVLREEPGTSVREEPGTSVPAPWSGSTTLVAYVTLRSGRMDEKALRDHLRTRLPDYMVPARFVQLDQMPRTPSGKVDRRALPAPAVERRREGRAAGTPLEEEIAAIIGGVLEQDAIPVNDSFFDLGGHSLHLLQVQTRMAERLGVNVEIVEFFRHPTVQDLAKLVERLREGGSVEVDPRRDRSDARLTQQDTLRQQLHARRGSRAGRPRA